MEILNFFLELPNPLPTSLTEADTRATIIDPVLARLGWSPKDVKREPYSGWADSKGYIDYLLLVDTRPMMVIEAKKVGRTFSIPSSLTKQKITTYRKLMATGSKDLNEAIDQCLRYSQFTGARYACATNGADWLFLKPSHPSRPLPEARVVVFQGIDQVVKRIDEFCDLLLPEAMQEGRAEKMLLTRDLHVPTFSERLQDRFPYRREPTIEEEEYSNILDAILKHYVIQLTDAADFEECYLPVKGNRGTSNTLDAILSARIDALKGSAAQTSLDFGSQMLAKTPLQNIQYGRTVILHGEVGVGKTSFLRHCELRLREDGRLKEAVWARIDLLPFADRRFAADAVDSMLDLICRKVQEEVAISTESMSGRYDPDAWVHLRDIYNREVRQFQIGRYPSSDDSDLIFLDAAREYVWQLSRNDPQGHLVRIIKWLTTNCKLPVVLALDNSDQLGLEFQEFLYKLCETLQEATSAVVILVVRTEALASHVIREHSVASVNEQFLVQKAPLPQVLQKRFAKILSQLPLAYAASANKVAQDRIVVLMETLQYEAYLGSDAFQIIEAAGNGSLRDSLRAVSAIFRSSPLAMDRLVVQQHELGRARLSVARTIRALSKEDIGSSDATKLIPNIFNVESQLTMPYTLGVRQLQHIKARVALFQYTVGALLNDFSVAGIDRTIAERTLIRLRSDRFVRVPHILPELRESDILTVTRLGDVLLDIILSEESYFSRVAFNTFIYDKDVFQNMRSAWTSNHQDYRAAFAAIARQFIAMVASDDLVMRMHIDASLLEPVVSAPPPGLLSSTHGS